MKYFKVLLTLGVALCISVASSLFVFASTPTTGWDTPVFFDFEPLPVGFFDGDMTADSQSLSINFNNLSSSESGTLHSQGLDRYSITVPSTSSFIRYTEGNSVVTNGWWNWSSGTFWNDPDDIGYSPNSVYWSSGTEDSDPSGGFGYSETHGAGSGTVLTDSYTMIVSQTANGDDSYTGSTDYSGTVTGSVAEHWNTDKRWYSWSVCIGTGYVWFCTDARNSVNSYSTKQSDDVFSFVVSIEGGHRCFCLVFNNDGTVSRSVDNGPGTDGSLPNFYFSSSFCSKESVTTPYWGFWQSDNSPGLKGFSSLTSGKTFLRTVIFGKDSLEFLNWQQLHTEISSLQSSISSSISNQTNTLVNTNSPGNFDQSSMGNTSNALTLESSFHAPSTNHIFSAGNTFTDGMGFWRDRMNELLFPANSPILPLTVFTLTLGLAALVIGRRVSGGGTA